MAKSKPIGVRFDLEKLELIQKEQNLTSAQQVLNYLMANYGKIKPISTALEGKCTVEPKIEIKAEIKPENEPKEGSLAFLRKYGVFTYAEIDKNS